MTKALTSTRLSPGGKGKKSKNRVVTEWDQYGRTGRTQVLHIELFYTDGTKGVINVTSPAIVWGEDIEMQWFHMKAYIKSQANRLGLVKYHAHAAHIQEDGTIEKSFSWHPFDLIADKEIFPY